MDTLPLEAPSVDQVAFSASADATLKNSRVEFPRLPGRTFRLDPAHAPPDALLFSRYLAGCQDSFAALYRRHQPDLLRFLKRYRLTRCPEDIAQQTWLRICRAKDKLGAPRNFRRLLLTIARHEASNERRAFNARLFARAHPTTDSVMQSRPPDNPFDAIPAECVAAIALLPRRTRRLLQLIYCENRSLVDAALYLAAPVGTAKTHLYRTLRRLRATCGVTCKAGGPNP